jgi:predicted transcriptional regulator
MKNYELKAIAEKIVELFKKKVTQDQSTDYTYFLAKNAKFLVEEYKIMESMKLIDEDEEKKLELHKERRRQILEKYCDKDENGVLKKVDIGNMTQYSVEQNADKIKEEGDKLDAEFKDVIDKKNATIAKFNEFMQKDVDPSVLKNLVRVNRASFPNGFDQKDQLILLDLID